MPRRLGKLKLQRSSAKKKRTVYLSANGGKRSDVSVASSSLSSAGSPLRSTAKHLNFENASPNVVDPSNRDRQCSDPQCDAYGGLCGSPCRKCKLTQRKKSAYSDGSTNTIQLTSEEEDDEESFFYTKKKRKRRRVVLSQDDDDNDDNDCDTNDSNNITASEGPPRKEGTSVKPCVVSLLSQELSETDGEQPEGSSSEHTPWKSELDSRVRSSVATDESEIESVSSCDEEVTSLRTKQRLETSPSQSLSSVCKSPASSLKGFAYPSLKFRSAREVLTTRSASQTPTKADRDIADSPVPRAGRGHARKRVRRATAGERTTVTALPTVNEEISIDLCDRDDSFASASPSFANTSEHFLFDTHEVDHEQVRKRPRRAVVSGGGDTDARASQFPSVRNDDAIDLCEENSMSDIDDVFDCESDRVEEESFTTGSWSPSRLVARCERDEVDDHPILPVEDDQWREMLPHFRTVRSLQADRDVTLYLDYDTLFNANSVRLGQGRPTCKCKGKCMRNCCCAAVGEACDERCGCDPRKCANKAKALAEKQGEGRGYWVTKNNRRTFITSDGKELTGSRAFKEYSKTKLPKKAKKKRKTSRRKAWRRRR